MRRLTFKKPTSERGMASIMVVGVLIIILSLVTIGFARLMNRELNQSLNNQLSTAATLAAESGINDALALVRDNPDLVINDCQTGINTLNTRVGPNTNNLTTDESTKYSCLLVDPSPTDIRFDTVPAGSSQVVKLTPKNGVIDELMFSWRASSGSINAAPPAGQPLLPDSGWTYNGSRKAPLLKVALYPTASNGTVLPNSRSFFLYPEDKQGNDNVSRVDYSVDGQLAGIRCGTGNLGGFQGNSQPSYCNAVIYNMQSAGSGATYYAKLTPVYETADIVIQGDTVSPTGIAEFIGAQTVVDVTAKSVDSVKRLQARASVTDSLNNVSNSTSQSVPEYALRSSGTICKRLIVPDDGTQIYTDTSVAGTTCNVVTLPPPTLNLYLDGNPNLTSKNVNVGGSGIVNWRTTNATRCVSSGDWNQTAVSGDYNTGALNTSRIYIYNMECFNALGVGSGVKTVTINVSPPCPAPLPVTLRAFNVADTYANLDGYVNPGTCPGLFSYFKWAEGNFSNSAQLTNQTGNSALVVNGGNQSSSPQLTGLKPSTTYSFQICSTYSSANCGQILQFTTQGAGGGPAGPPDCRITEWIQNFANLADGETKTVSGKYSHCYAGCRGSLTIVAGWGWFGPNPSNGSDNDVPFNGSVRGDYSRRVPGGNGWGAVICESGRGGGSDMRGIYVNPPSSGPGPGPGGSLCSPSNQSSSDCYTQSSFQDCDLGNGQPGGYPNSSTCRADGGVWATFCRIGSRATGQYQFTRRC